MFFPACATLASKHPDLRRTIEEFDRRFSKAMPTATFETSTVAPFLQLEVDAAMDLLNAMCPDVLIQKAILRCPQCGTLNENCNENEEGNVRCTQCQTSIALSSDNWVSVFQFSVQARQMLSHARRPPNEPSGDLSSTSHSGQEIHPSALPSPVVDEGHTHPVVVFPLHGIRTRGTWVEQLSDVLTANGWRCRQTGWNFGWFWAAQLLMPWARQSRVRWFRSQYTKECDSMEAGIGKDGYPSVIAHSFGTYILGYALLKYETIRFNKVIVVGSILPRSFPWDKLLDRGQVQEVRCEYGAYDFWTRVCSWLIPGTGAAGNYGFTCTHAKLQQRGFNFDHSGYFEKKHINDFWLTFLRQPAQFVGPSDAYQKLPRGDRGRLTWLTQLVLYSVLAFGTSKLWAEAQSIQLFSIIGNALVGLFPKSDEDLVWALRLEAEQLIDEFNEADAVDEHGDAVARSKIHSTSEHAAYVINSLNQIPDSSLCSLYRVMKYEATAQSIAVRLNCIVFDEVNASDEVATFSFNKASLLDEASKGMQAAKTAIGELDHPSDDSIRRRGKELLTKAQVREYLGFYKAEFLAALSLLGAADAQLQLDQHLQDEKAKHRFFWREMPEKESIIIRIARSPEFRAKQKEKQ